MCQKNCAFLPDERPKYLVGLLYHLEQVSSQPSVWESDEVGLQFRKGRKKEVTNAAFSTKQRPGRFRHNWNLTNSATCADGMRRGHVILDDFF